MVVEIEAAVEQRHGTRIDPVGDVDVVVGQKRLDRAAQQCREMAGKRRHQQHRRPGWCVFLAEMEQVAERVTLRHLLHHLDHAAVDCGALDAEGRALVSHAGAAEHLAGRRGAAHHRMIGEKRPGLGQQALHGLGHRPYRREDVGLGLIGLIKHMPQSWCRYGGRLLQERRTSRSQSGNDVIP